MGMHMHIIIIMERDCIRRILLLIFSKRIITPVPVFVNRSYKAYLTRRQPQRIMTTQNILK